MRLVRCNWIRKFASTRVHNNLKSFLRSSLTIFDHNLNQNFPLLLQFEYHEYLCMCIIAYLIVPIMIAPIFFVIYAQYNSQSIFCLQKERQSRVIIAYLQVLFSIKDLIGTIYNCTFILSSFPRYRRYVTMTNQ